MAAKSIPNIQDVANRVIDDPAVKKAAAQLKKTIPAERLYEHEHPAVDGKKHESQAFVKAEGHLVDALADSLHKVGVLGAPHARDLTGHRGGHTHVTDDRAADFEAATIRMVINSTEIGNDSSAPQSGLPKLPRGRGQCL